MSQNHESLAKKKRKNGFDYTQVLRGSRSCIFEQRLWGILIAYEVFIIRISPKRKILGKWIKEKELFPCNEAFGYTAWTYWTHEQAFVKYRKLEKNDNVNETKKQHVRTLTEETIIKKE